MDYAAAFSNAVDRVRSEGRQRAVPQVVGVDHDVRVGTLAVFGVGLGSLLVAKAEDLASVAGKATVRLYTQVATIPAVEAFAPADPKLCPLVKG